MIREIRLNTKMSRMLKALNISEPFAQDSSGTMSSDDFELVNDSLVLRDEYQKTNADPTDFIDRTGYEAFVNHAHLPYDGSRDSLQSCLSYLTTLQKGLAEFGRGRSFVLILSVSDDSCVVRFHQARPGEDWVAADLEGYLEEGVLVLSVEPSGKA